MMEKNDQLYLQRTLDLARIGAGYVSPNPMVGACIVHQNRIIGEGFHQKFGGPHAEVDAVNNVRADEKHLIPDSTLYVSLEPCAHQGKTPPCTDLIIRNNIQRVVLGVKDPNPEVSGNGVKKLKAEGIAVDFAEDPSPFIYLNRSFWINQTQQRAYILGKIARSADGYIGVPGKKVWLSNGSSTTESHRLRADADAIIVGVNTVLNDDPELTTRLVPGNNPIRIIPDLNNRIKKEARVFNDDAETWYLTCEKKSFIPSYVRQIVWDDEYIDPLKLSRILYKEGIGQAVLEGGSALMRSFYHANCLDEFIEITTPAILEEGVRAPDINMTLVDMYRIENDIHRRFYSRDNLKNWSGIS